MTPSSPSSDRRHARRLLVTLVITTATAAVTAGVVLKKHPPAAIPVQHAEAGPALALVAPASPAFPHRVEWRDPWKRSAAGSDSSATSIDDHLHRAAGADPSAPAEADPSVPSAAAALERGAEPSDEPATF
ncbi:MAG TPA: hypothetical protein VLD35_04435 [Caldimonas sp.]|nr:hypothetical protein [Caldimonas sp.]